jgi:hypothetical protein
MVGRRSITSLNDKDAQEQKAGSSNFYFFLISGED